MNGSDIQRLILPTTRKVRCLGLSAANVVKYQIDVSRCKEEETKAEIQSPKPQKEEDEEEEETSTMSVYGLVAFVLVILAATAWAGKKAWQRARSAWKRRESVWTNDAILNGKFGRNPKRKSYI